jgi:type IV secretion system protein VirB1
MDLSAFMALAERCEPGIDARALIPIVRAASGFESLSLTIDGRKPIKILATSKDEAIALAMQAKVAGNNARLGIAGLTFDDLQKAEISVSDAFDACPSLRVAARIQGEAGRGAEQGGVSKGALRVKRSVDGDTNPQVDRSVEQTPMPVEQEQPAKQSWDVFGNASASSLLVYRASASLRTRRD